MSADSEALERLYSALERWVAEEPGALGAEAVRFAQQIGLSSRVYFSFSDAPPLLQMPLWLGRDLPAPVADRVLMAAALSYALIRIQDNLLDEPTSRGHAPQLLVGNLMFWDALAELRALGLSEAFWGAARAAWSRSQHAAAAELVALQRRTSYSSLEYEAHCQKVALAEIPLLAVLDLQGRLPVAAATVTELVHELGKSYGIFNDVLGYRRDLRAGGQTFLLAQIRERLGLVDLGRPDNHPLEIVDIEAVLLREPLLESFLQRAGPWHTSARALAQKLEMPALVALLDRRDARVEELAGEISTLRLVSALSTSGASG